MSASFDSAQFRAVLGHVPTSVVVVTGLNAQGAAFGITIGSFASVSLDPPLVGFFPGVRSQSWAAIRESGRFCVNVLGSHQEEACWRFAKEGDDKFAGVDVDRDESLGLVDHDVAAGAQLQSLPLHFSCQRAMLTRRGSHFDARGERLTKYR